MSIKKSLKKVLIVFMALVTASLIFGCSQKKEVAINIPKPAVDMNKATDIALNEASDLREYLEPETPTDYNISSIKLLGNTPDGITSLKTKDTVEVDASKPSYEVKYTENDKPMNLALYIDANSGEVLGVVKKDS